MSGMIPMNFNPMRLDGRLILVTGASSGIGRATAGVLAGLGARLVLVGRDEGRLRSTMEQLGGSGHFCEPYDLSKMDGVAEWLKLVSSKRGPFSGLVHAAGIHQMRPLRMVSPDDLRSVMDVNLGSAIQLVRGFRQRGVCVAPASVVLLSSVVASVGQPGVVAYSASKGALVAACRSMAMELAREGIRVNCILPSMVKSEMLDHVLKPLSDEQVAAIRAMHPLGFGEPEDVAMASAFLLAETGRWITGTALVVDGGYTAH
jgi:3-oxoacyl-[acyl-carrier protein] reductase